MHHKELVAILIFALATLPCLADVVLVSSSQQISGSGSATICGPFTVEDSCPVVGFNSFVGAPGSATASGFSFNTEWILTSSVDVQPGPISVSSNNINIQLGVDADVNGTVHRGGGQAQVSNIYDLEFDLTSPSLVQLTGATENPGSGLPADTAVAQILLSGSNFQLQVAPPPGAFDLLATLEPGVYDLAATTEASVLTGNNFDGSDFENPSISLNADFTPIPEARYSGLVLALLAAIWGFGRQRTWKRRALTPKT